MEDSDELPDFGQFLSDDQELTNSFACEEIGEDLEHLYEEQRLDCVLRWDLLDFTDQPEKNLASSDPLEEDAASLVLARKGQRRFIRETSSLKLLGSGLLGAPENTPTSFESENSEVLLQKPDVNTIAQLTDATESEDCVSERRKSSRSFAGKLKGAIRKNQAKFKEKSEMVLKKIEDTSKATGSLISGIPSTTESEPSEDVCIENSKPTTLKFMLFDDLLIWGEAVKENDSRCKVAGIIIIDHKSYVEDLTWHPDYLGTWGKDYIGGFRVVSAGGKYVDIGICSPEKGGDSCQESADETIEVKSEWIQILFELIRADVKNSQAVSLSKIGWKHSIVRGNIWSYALNGNYEALQGMLKEGHSHEEDAYDGNSIDVNLCDSNNASGSALRLYWRPCGLLQATASPRGRIRMVWIIK